MPKMKLNNSTCNEIRCDDCPLNDIACASVIDMSTTFGDAHKKLKKVVDLLEKDLEKEVEVDE